MKKLMQRTGIGVFTARCQPRVFIMEEEVQCSLAVNIHLDIRVQIPEAKGLYIDNKDRRHTTRRYLSLYTRPVGPGVWEAPEGF